MDGLREQCSGQVLTGTMIAKIDRKNDHTEVICYNTASQETTLIRAKKLLLSTPQYVNKYLLPERKSSLEKLQYAPWVVANITLSRIPQGKGVSLCWDNVMYGRPSVGYVYANHQDVSSPSQGVISYYLPLTGNVKQRRSEVYTASYEHWRDKIVNELSYAHENIEAYISHLDIWIWGHGMILPETGYIWNSQRREHMRPIDDKIFFAHSDLSGISIFEEAFYQGIRAANEIIRSL
jgi:hypothetical protein